MQSIRPDFSKAAGLDSHAAFIFMLSVIFFLLQDDDDRRKRRQAQDALTARQDAQLRKRRGPAPP